MFKNLITFIKKFLTTSGGSAEISKTREVSASSNREVKDSGQARMTEKLVMESLSCPYCSSVKFQKRGFRQKKLEKVQLYICLSCNKTFTPHSTKGKHYPLSVMLDAISIYNLGYSLEQTCGIMNTRLNIKINEDKSTKKPTSSAGLVHLTNLLNGWSDNLIGKITQKKQLVKSLNTGVDSPGVEPGRLGLSDQPSKPAEPTPASVSHVDLQPSTLSNWLLETTELCRFSRMREFALKKYSPREMVIHTTLAHRQLYRYRFHRAKCALMIQEEYQHRKFTPLSDFLEMVPVECPHQYFREGLRASETPLTFMKTQMIVRAKQNYATKIAAFVLQSVKERKGRHEALQKFMLANDSVTVATEVPVYLTRDDIEHMQTQLGFEIFSRVIPTEVEGSLANAGTYAHSGEIASSQAPRNDNVVLPKLITGHIDILQIRNGQIHILDYKPDAEKERPIEQLTLYAMALSRLTGLRLFEFKCAWFDEKDYFEFYPLHVLHKTKKGARRRKVRTSEGIYAVNKNPDKVERIRPI